LAINIHVIFSSINSPTKTLVQQSLRSFNDESNVCVITSKRYAKSWSDLGSRVQIAKFDSTSEIRIFARKFLLRSGFLRRSLRFCLQRIFKQSRQIMMPPHNARHFEYLRAINPLNPNDWVVLVDSRDLIFQVSPQEIINSMDKRIPIHLFLENGKFFKNGQIQHNELSWANWNWASQILNGDLAQLEKLKGTEIINSGCIIGRVAEMRIFLEKSCNLLAKSLYSSYALLDQASVNVLAYCAENDFDIAIHANGETVLNMCGVVEERTELKEGKLYVNNQLVPVAHQFDRFGTWSPSHGLVFDKREYKVQ
jgi:hypothetical protein